MKIKFITSASDPNHPGWKQLERSLIHFGWDFTFIQGEWIGYAGKMLYPYQYLKEGNEKDCDLIVISDAYDSFFLAPPEEVIEKYLSEFSPKNLYYGERACWPHPHLESKYPPCESPYKHVNGGGFIELDMPVPSAEFNDQAWSTGLFLNRNSEANIVLDHQCEIFQCTGHWGPPDFKYRDGRLVNNHTGQVPCIIHFNGHSFIQEVYDLVH
jgi:hypothetical protein